MESLHLDYPSKSPPLMQSNRILDQRYRKFFFYFQLSRRKCALLIITVLAYFLLYNLPGPPKTENDTRANRPPPQYDVEVKPRFLYHSPFRQHPDMAYEDELDEALKRIEHIALRSHYEDGDAPKTIWQIMLGKDRDMDRSSDSVLFEEQNKEWDYRLITSSLATKFVTEAFSTLPDVLTTYKSYPRDVQRADLLRYLLLWYYGGYYSDMDVFPARTIQRCPSLDPIFPSASDFAEAQQKPNISLVLGVEIDEPHASPRLMHDWHWSRSYGFIQYTMYAPKRFSPLLRKAIVRVLSHTKQHHQNRSVFHWGKARYDEKEILEVTGPGVFTDAILDVLSETLPSTHELVAKSTQADAGIGDLKDAAGGKIHERVTWAPFHRLRQPMWIDASEAQKDMGGLGVLPISVWGNGQRHSGAEDFRSVHACVNHRFGRTWKKGWWEYFFG